ncbi:MAG TPA: hypothetical protein VN205_00360 [Thermomonas sp.]|nr:hypothetical protein [Thermomonas sp.]
MGIAEAPAKPGNGRGGGLSQDGLALWLVVAVAALSPLVLWAFWPRYLSPAATPGAHLHAHAATGTAWLALLVAQPWLVRTRRLAAHRALGRAGVLVGIGFIATGLVSAQRWLAGLDAGRLAREGGFLYLILGMTLMFAVALALGIRWRRSPAVHGRFMACTLLPLLDPVFGRLLGMHFPSLPATFLYQLPALMTMAGVLATLALTVPRAAPGRTGFLVFAGMSVLLFLLFFAVEHHPAWLACVAWLKSLTVG